MLENSKANQHFQNYLHGFFEKRLVLGILDFWAFFTVSSMFLTQETLPESVWVPLSCSVAWKLPQGSKLDQL